MGKCKKNDAGIAVKSKLWQVLFDRMYRVSLKSFSCMEYAAGSQVVLCSMTYEKWLVKFAADMYRSDVAGFLSRMDLVRILQSLNGQEPCYVVFCRKIWEGQEQEYQLNIVYSDETCTELLILRQKLTRELPRPMETINELAHCNGRFQFLVNHVTENFIEIDIEKEECCMFPAENGMKTRELYQEQIEWWAQNIIVPEEREAYKKEYALENLVPALRAGNGRHMANYTSLRGETRIILKIVSTLVKENYGGNKEYIFAYCQDVTYLKEQEQRNERLVDFSRQLINMSQTEMVTGLLNRAAGEGMIMENIAQSQNAWMKVMLLIDIDYFKGFNDRYGHQTGDFVLRAVGNALKDTFRSDDIICRWGGDEFVVFMCNAHGETMVKSRIERLRARLLQCSNGEEALPVTISIGGSMVKPDLSFKELFNRCDKALYHVKQHGRDDYYICF